MLTQTTSALQSLHLHNGGDDNHMGITGNGCCICDPTHKPTTPISTETYTAHDTLAFKHGFDLKKKSAAVRAITGQVFCLDLPYVTSVKIASPLAQPASQAQLGVRGPCTM